MLADLLIGGRASQSRGWLGLYCEELDGALRVLRVPSDGPAHEAGARPGDRVVAIGGAPVGTLPELYRRLWRTTHPGDRVTVELERAGELLTLEIEAIDRYQRYRLAPRKR